MIYLYFLCLISWFFLKSAEVFTFELLNLMAVFAYAIKFVTMLSKEIILWFQTLYNESSASFRFG